MTFTEVKSNLSAIARLALVPVLIILIILAGVAGYFSSGSRTVTSTVTSTVTTTAPPITTTTTVNITYVSSQTMATQGPSSQFPSYSMNETNVSTVNSTLGLSLELFAAPSNGSLGNLSISAEVVGARNVSTNVTDENNWPYVADSFGPCGAPGHVAFGIFQGYYDQSNYTNANSLLLYNPSVTYSCTTFAFGIFTYSFQPHSDVAELLNSSGVPVFNESISTGGLIAGYWQEGGTYQVFPAGNYTIMAADEWGQVAFLHFTVTPNCQTFPFGCDESTITVSSGGTP